MSDSVTNVDNSSALANSLFTTLTTGIAIPTLPDLSGPLYSIVPDTGSDLYSDITGATIAAVTEDSLTGAGAFDVFMSAMDKHLEREFQGNRITGAQYAEAYVAITNQVIGQAVAFTLQKDQAKWNAVTAQMQARIAEIQATQAMVELETAKIAANQKNFELNLTGAQYALTKMQIATEEARHDDVTTGVAMKTYELNYGLPADVALKQYELEAILPSTVAMNEIQVDRILPAQAAISEFQHRVLLPLEEDLQTLQRDRIVPIAADIEQFRRDYLQPIEYGQQQHVLYKRQPAETELVTEQVEVQRANTMDTRRDTLTPVTGVIGVQKRNLTADADIKDFTLKTQLPTQVELVDKQINLTEEQTESERSKTLDVRTDGDPVVGSVGKQKDLYTQQIDSFIKDAAHKTAKMYLDGWITQKTLDEGLNAPNQLTNTEIDEVLVKVRTNNDL